MEFPIRGRPLHNPNPNDASYNPNLNLTKPKDSSVVFGKSPDRFFEQDLK